MGGSPTGWRVSEKEVKKELKCGNIKFYWRRKWQPTPVFSPGESQGRGSLVGCRLWGRTESDRLKRLSSSRVPTGIFPQAKSCKTRETHTRHFILPSTTLVHPACFRLLFKCLPVTGSYIFPIAYGCYLRKTCSYGINSAIIRSGTSDLSILGSTPQECWERVRGEKRDKEMSLDAAMRCLRKEDESSQQQPLWGKKRSYLRVPGSEISILQRNGQHLSLH